MVDFAETRRMMVDGQVRTSDVTDLRLIAAMLDVPRERFVPSARQAIAYLDLDIPVGDTPGGTRVLLKPMVLGKLLQAAGVGAGDRALDVGCATGYSSAILSELAAAVIALEEDAVLTKMAKAALAGAANVSVVTGPLVAGWPAEAPYDVILLQGSIEVAPDALLRQLRDGGRLLAIAGSRPLGKATIYRASFGHVTAQPLFDASAPLLPGFAKAAEFVF